MKLLLLSFFLIPNDTVNKDLSKITTSTYMEDTAASRNKWGVTLGGHIGTDLFWDTRQVVESRDGLLLFYPDNVKKDINDKDINARPSFNFLALNSRLTVRIKAPDALGAKVSGMVEGWFAGISNNDMNGFAMRHAFIKMEWERTNLLMGQTWHPLFTEYCFANTVAGSAGAPFQAFSRAPQIRFVKRFSKEKIKSWEISKIMLYINAQRDFLSFGSAGNSSSYLRNSAMPELGAQYIFEHQTSSHYLLLGLGIDYKYIIPRVVTDSNVYTRNGVHAPTAIVFISYEKYLPENTNFGIKAKGLYGQACNEFLLLGGYAYKYYDNNPLNPNIDYNYTTINTLAAWIDIYAKIKQWEVGLFGGYTQNLGSMKNIQDWNNPNSYFSRGYDIAYLYRISARAIYKVKKLQFGLEPEYTTACYGDTRNSLGQIQNPCDDYPNAQKNIVANLRILVSTTLFF